MRLAPIACLHLLLGATNNPRMASTAVSTLLLFVGMHLAASCVELWTTSVA